MTGSTHQLDAQALDILRTAMEVAFADQTDEEIAAYFDVKRVREVGALIDTLYARGADADPVAVIA